VGGDLRVTGYPNVFALGDVCDVKEAKMGYYAGALAVVCSYLFIPVQTC
jgi:NADH dehydrogenase FAD-containing subunit